VSADLAVQDGPLAAASRMLAFYLKAAWDVEAKIQPLAEVLQDGELRADRPVLAGPVIFLPSACDNANPRLLYLASVAHAAAHLTFSTMRFEPAKLRPLQLMLAGAIEDARVERLAMLRYPGLRRWWLPFHRTGTESAKTAPALIARLSRGLLDPAYIDDDGWVKKGRALFEAGFARTNGLDPAISRELGNLLGNDLGQMRVQFNAKTYVQDAAYRDDNSPLWNTEPTPITPSPSDEPAERNATMQESQTVRDLPGEGRAASAAASGEEEQAFELTSVARYREWDYVIRRYRPNWCRVESLEAALADQATLPRRDEGSEKRLRAIFRKATHRVAAGKTRACEGDVLDLDACIAGRIDARRGERDDIKGFVTQRMRPESGVLAVLLDLSASAAMAGRIRTALASSCMLGRALSASGRRYAMYGFHSDGRERVRFHVFKDFDQPWSPDVEARLMHTRPGLSTRFGAALRHVGEKLRAEVSTHAQATILVVSDGEPYDIDSFDPRYLREDMRRAIVELATQDIRCACLALDPGSFDQAIAMFGRRCVAPLVTPGGLAKALRRIV
jgi:nitric oxide reductase NorD protein